MSLFDKIDETVFRDLRREGKGLYISYGDSPLNSSDPGIPGPNEDENYNSSAYQVQARANDLVRVTKATTTRNPSFWPKQSVLYSANQGPFKNLIRDKLLKGGREIALGAISTPLQAGVSGVERIPFAGRGTGINPGYLITNARNENSEFLVSIGGVNTKNPVYFSIDPTEKRGFSFVSLLGNSLGKKSDLPRKDRTEDLGQLTEENQKGKFVNEDSLQKNTEFFKFDSTAQGEGFKLSEPRLNSNGDKAVISRDDRLEEEVDFFKEKNTTGRFVNEETLEKDPELFKFDETAQGEGFKLSEPRLNSNGDRAVIDRDDRLEEEIESTTNRNNTGQLVDEESNSKKEEFFRLASTTEDQGFKETRKDRNDEDIESISEQNNQGKYVDEDSLTKSNTFFKIDETGQGEGFNETRKDRLDQEIEEKKNTYSPSIRLNNRLGYDENSDYINSLDVQTERIPESDSKQIIPFEIVVYDPGRLEAQDYLYFRAYLENLSDNFGGTWNSTKYIGRAEDLYNYGGFTRGISFGFKLAAHSEDDMSPLYKKLNLLTGTTAPSYSENQSFMRGIFTKLTIGDYVRRLPGFFTSVNLSWDTSYPWEIGIDENGNKNNIPRAPHILDVSLEYQPVHDFNPAYGQYFIDAAVPRGSVTVEPLQFQGVL